jgi:hypothetical protein
MALGFTDPVISFDITATVTSTSVSAAVNMGGACLMGLFVSTDTHKGTTITFQAAAASTGPWHVVASSSGNSVSIAAVSTQATRYYALDPVNFTGIQHLKVVSSSTIETATYTLAVRPYGI